MKRTAWFVPIALSIVGSAWGQVSPVTPVVRKVSEAVDARRALETVKVVYANDRWFTFPKFGQTVRELKKRLEEGGASSVEVGALRADGVSRAGFWTAPLAWDVQSASLEMMAPERMELCDYAKVPTCLGMWSGPTPAAGVEAELVDLDATPWSQVRGKLVLTSQNAANLKERLAQNGALGAVNGFSESPELGDDRQWINAWGDHGWGFLKSSTPLLSYSVTPNQAAKLRELLAAGKKVTLRARAATRDPGAANAGVVRFVELYRRATGADSADGGSDHGGYPGGVV
jgi:hypothetical protein